MDADHTQVTYYPETLDQKEAITIKERSRNGYSVPTSSVTSSDVESDDDDTAKLLSSRGSGHCSSEQDGATPHKDELIFGYTRRQAKIVVAFVLLSVSEVFAFSVFTPFFPIVAKEMNMTQTQIGATFAGYSIGGIAGAMITGTLLGQFGAKFLIVAGVFTFAVATIFFGVLKMFSSTYFFTLCMLSRLIMGFGSNVSFTALFAVVFKEFEDRSLTVIGLGETLCSVGGMIGPLVGAALYALGGYTLPFFVVGGILILETFIAFYAIPTGSVENKGSSVSPARLLLNLYGIFGALFVLLAFTLLSFISSNLSVHLIETYDVKPALIGVYMVTGSISYGISTTLFGYITDAKKCGPHLMAVGGIIWAISMIFYGPPAFVSDWFGWDKPKLWLSFVMYAIICTSTGAVIMPTFSEMIESASHLKVKVNKIGQYGLVSGLWNTMFSVGEILGPSLGGPMVEKYNFSNSCILFGMSMGILGIFKILHLVVLSREGKRKRNSEMEDAILGMNEID